jgi:hypothetical protein
MTMKYHASFDTSVAELNATSTLVKAFEAVNNKRAAKGLGMTLMAVSLAACGSDEVVITTPTGDVDVTDLVADTTPVALSAVEAQAATLLSTISASDVAVEAATIAAGAAASVMANAGQTLAPATAAAATTDFNAALAEMRTEIITGTYDADVTATTANGLDSFEQSAALYDYTSLSATLAASLTATQALTAAAKTALAADRAELAAALSFEAAADNNAFLAQAVVVNTAALTTDDHDLGTAAIKSIGTFLGNNNATNLLVADAAAGVTAAQTLAGQIAYAAALETAIFSSSAALAATAAAFTTVQATAVTNAILAAVQGVATTTADADSGDILADTAVVDTIAAIDAALDTAGVGMRIDDVSQGMGVIIMMPFLVGLNAPVAGAEHLIELAADAAFDAAIAAELNTLIALADAVSAADETSAVAAIEAGSVATSSLGADNIDIDGGAATAGNDVFIFNEANGNMTIGAAATAAAPGNVLFGAGDDSLIIAGEYTFVTIDTAAAQASLATTAVGDAAVLEVFVFQNATSGDTVLSFEDSAFDGSVTAGVAMTTLTLTDTTFADLELTTVDGNTILAETAAVIA